MAESIRNWVARFELHPWLRPHAEAVLESLPAHVREDLMNDPAFLIADYEPMAAGEAPEVPVGGLGADGRSRSVVLKRSVRFRPARFIRWLIAHELAHAHLRNDGRFKGEDPECAADTLAAEWGFPNPAR